MKKNIAIVTPVFNTQEYLHRCIKSILNQSGVTFEYFIIDDGSTDNSANIIQYYQKKDSRIIFIQKNNEGQGAARNLAIKLANSDYIYFVDSDDYLGENTLSILYHAAKRKNLDICSPNIPQHYFDKPLEYIPCLPCKSQFIRLDIIKKYDIYQPVIRSGQDGVFSHLVLTHCTRIGMASNATFYYTHAREGSTFAKHLKRHDLIPSLILEHFNTIIKYYDKYHLWTKNGLRLLNFISDESLRNRLDPHFSYLNEKQKEKVFNILSSVAKKALKFISEKEKIYVNNAVIYIATSSLNDFVKNYANKFLINTRDNTKSILPKSSNFIKNNILICKYYNFKLSPKPIDKVLKSSLSEKKNIFSTTSKNNKIATQAYPTNIIDNKLDFIINTINNSTIQLASLLRSKNYDLKNANSDIVVSLTTLPHRLNIVHYAIESIFLQTMRPSQVILWVTDSIAMNQFMTPQLEELESRGLEIKQAEDVGPHTKLVHTLKNITDKNIITFDDDMIYPINAIECLWTEHLRYPNAVIANWARELAFDASGIVKNIRSGKLLTPPSLEIEQANAFEGKPNIKAFPYGTSGILYPPKSLNEKVFDVSTFKKLCPKEDDIWFKAMSLLNHIPVVVTNLNVNPSHHCIYGSQIKALRHSNHGLGENEKQMQNIFEYFDLYKIFN